MEITGQPYVEVQNNILSGFYYLNFNNGIQPKLYEFSSPAYPISNFNAPYDAILPAPQGSLGLLTAVGKRLRSDADYSERASDRAGKLYFSDTATLYGTCHGFGRDFLTFYTGFNFYQAFYPAGYFSPPYGESLSIFKANSNSAQANSNATQALNNGACSNINITEYNETFGIVSITDSDVGDVTDSLSANMYAPIYSAAEVCPPPISITSYYDELNFNQIQGTTTQLGAGTFYNGNPIPTSLDIFNIKLNSRYNITGAGDGRMIVYYKNGTNIFKPQESYSASNQENLLNNVLCLAGIMENNTSAGAGTNGDQMIQAPDQNLGNAGSQSFINQGTDTAWNYWHFTFKENADTLPFSNNFSAINGGEPVSATNEGANEGTQLFLPVLSSSDAYWQNRQCPDTVDFLPWTFGASIYACPSYHFDVPYYAAIKKFGFYGTRFLNTCNALNLTNTWNGVANAIELPASTTNVPIAENLAEPAGVDAKGSWSFAVYDNLLNTAKAEERFSNMFALNKGFFLWANTGNYTSDPNFLTLSQISGFGASFSALIGQFSAMFTGGLSSFVSGVPAIIVQKVQAGNGVTELASSTYVGNSNSYNDLMFSNQPYQNFLTNIGNFFPTSGLPYLNIFANQYGSFVMDQNGNPNESFYSGMISGREQRTLTRYMENTVQGNPIDLFPINHILFSFDSAREYLENTGWNRGLGGFANTQLPVINQRFFEGAYGNASQITGLLQVLDSLNFIDNTSFYPGFFNDITVNKDIPTPSYVPVVSGIILDNQGRSFSSSGWLALGYNEIGKLDGNFSCFTPIFVQQPLDNVFTKIGQAPTLRAMAVDYHSIPDDKITPRYPEILYWAYNLKLVDDKFNNLYPVQYKWLRVPISQYAGWFMSGILTGDYASVTGDWSCLENGGSNCTICHLNQSSPTGVLGTTDQYTFLKGVNYGIDDQYYYMCVASGRFGVRISEPTTLTIENWTKFDVSLKLGLNQSNMPLSLNFIINDVNGENHSITFAPLEPTVAYQGYQADPYAIPEAVIEEKVPPPNAGYGDVSAFKCVGPIGYVGATRSYQPDTLEDTRGVRGAWGRFIEYGSLISLGKALNQLEGDLLYGYQHLPKCVNYEMPYGNRGAIVSAQLGSYYISHWTLDQQAVAATADTVGMIWTSLTNVAQLYPPITTRGLPGTDPYIAGFAIGQWQWGNNLGAIKRFGYLSTPASQDLVFTGPGSPSTASTTSQLLNQVKQKILSPNDLAGSNCGYSILGLGRNMLYYLEAYDRFYLLCDDAKKKNVQDISFICPGLRATNSAIQYCWLGHPSNTYVERHPMYGPYAYQWKVNRHNRDRNGNGISEGFYSMEYRTKYTLLYDAPAIYGLYLKKDASQMYKNKVNDMISYRNALFPGDVDITSLRGIWLGVGGSEGDYLTYGNMFCSSDTDANSALCQYISQAQSFGSSPDFQAYGCDAAQLALGQCFDPCLSMRYGQGFLAGGKVQNLFGDKPTTSQNVNTAATIRLVASSNLDKNGNIITTDEQSVIDPNIYFRSPINTPHARAWRGLSSIPEITINPQNIVGMSPCKDGGTDHCNYITPTVHLNTSTILLTSSSAFVVAKNYAANLYESYNIAGSNND